jgi:hypothetical protein
MSTAIDNFTSQLHDNLAAVEDSPKATLRERAKSLNKSIKSATKKNQVEIQSKLDEAKAATLTAICNRMDAETAPGNSNKH